MDNSYRDFFLKNKKLLHEHNQEFLSIFHVSLGTYWDILTGFDVVKFDEEFIKPPDGRSTNEMVNEIYGERAQELCHILIGYNE